MRRKQASPDCEGAGSELATVVAQGDRSVALRLAMTLSTATLALAAMLVPLWACVARDSGQWEWRAGCIISLAVWAVAVLAIAPATVWWWLVPGRVTYEVSGRDILAFRGPRLVARACADDFDEVAVVGLLTVRRLVFGWMNSPTDAVPQLWLTRDDRTGMRRLPRVLVWGAGGKQRFEEQLLAALGGAGSEIRIRTDRATDQAHP